MSILSSNRNILTVAHKIYADMPEELTEAEKIIASGENPLSQTSKAFTVNNRHSNNNNTNGQATYLASQKFAFTKASQS